jgi:hypothetical protein
MTPNPGSDAAYDLGCQCACLDNGHGNEELGKIRGFYITVGCPVHDHYDNTSDKPKIIPTDMEGL